MAIVRRYCGPTGCTSGSSGASRLAPETPKKQCLSRFSQMEPPMSYEVRRQRTASNRMKPIDGNSSTMALPIAAGGGTRLSGRIDHFAARSVFISEPGGAKAASKLGRRPLRRLTVELALVILAKLAFLMLIWWLLFAPHPKPDASADAIARRLAPSSAHPETHP